MPPFGNQTPHLRSNQWIRADRWTVERITTDQQGLESEDWQERVFDVAATAP